MTNPFEVNKLQWFTRTCLQSRHKQDDSQGIMPPYRITFKSITSDAIPIKNSVQKIDVRHMNACQIIPGIMYTHRARLNGVLVITILNEVDVKCTIEYVTRYCYAPRSAPFNTTHAVCSDYSISWKMYLNNCKGDDEVIPVTVLLASIYNACYTFQVDKRENLLKLTLQGLEHGDRGTISDKAFVRTFSEYYQASPSYVTTQK